ncbi:Fungal transcriptional regulatory protein, N-terminal [Penicillium camemberti]|uniref:Fungal transcriptional regulatory protein, N-terminal n=1 Tax=Penicillium camemberti (strain FM 013) TaxID=1429867 RepID=A0A0G4P665_PENC3|nr:Fungal transcriptional regulatory protein, N-terminal [Penicillium camemberti]
MSSRTTPKDHSSPLPVCDSCFSRKVRCDRGNPCGNCQDNNTTCTRQRVMKRTKKSSQLAVVKNTSRTRPKSPQATPTPQDLQISSPGPSDYSSTTSNTYPRLDYQQSHGEPPGSNKPLSLHDAHATIQYQLDNMKWLPINRRQILESGLGLASQLSGSFEDPAQVVSDITVNEEQIRTPSFELLTWMLKDIKEATLGSFVRDYFRHISEAALKQMGLNLLHRTGSPHDLLISTVCVNSMASRFLTAITTTGIDSELIHEMTHSVVQLQAAAKVALRSISLLTSPSLALLQALISGIFLHQGSGDVTVCWELTKAACRVCMSLGLDTIIKMGGTVSEEQYYCVAWCYILDKNFAFKMGRSKPLLDIELGHFISDLSGHRHPTSDLFQIYMSLARVQSALVPYLGGRSSILTVGLSSSHGIGKSWLVNMQQIRERIEHISSPYLTWRGLDAQSEISALQFAYHSIMTTIFHITEGAGDQSIDIRKQCLLEAHQGISSLVSICISAERQNTVALLHWTLLVYPITAYFVLFCNVIATLDTDDFKLMTTITDCLTRIETTSRPIIQVRTIFQHFLSLAGEVFDDESNATVSSQDHQLQSQSTTLQPWMPDDLLLPSGETADAVSPFSPSLLAGMEDFSDIPFFPENEMYIPFSDHFPDFGNDPSI